jgi:hypothetical protein
MSRQICSDPEHISEHFLGSLSDSLPSARGRVAKGGAADRSIPASVRA